MRSRRIHASPKEIPLSYDVLFNEVPCYISIQDRELKILRTNRRFREAFGNKSGTYCYQVYKNRKEKCPVCVVEKTFYDGKSHKSEETWFRQDGTQVEVIVYTTPIFGGSDNIIAVMEMSTDITEVKTLQRKLKESQERLAYLFEEVPCYISIQDRDLRITRVNRKFREDFGDGVGSRCYYVYKHRQEECLVCPVSATFADGQVHTSEEVLTSKNGEPIHVLVTTAPIRDRHGEISHVMEMSTNITEIRMLQSRLESLGMLVGSLSHGIKGLLTGLDGGVYFLTSGLEKDDMGRIKKGWDMLERNVAKIRHMILDLLYYAKEREPVWSPVAPHDLAESIAHLFEGKAEKLGITFEKSIALDMRTFEGDADALHAMLVSIVENSIDACRMDRMKKHHSIQFRVWQSMDDTFFEVEDNGIGMDQETRDKLFCMFFSSKGIEGTGLGLFIANKIATLHGGKITVESSPGEGTTFLIRIPLIRF